MARTRYKALTTGTYRLPVSLAESIQERAEAHGLSINAYVVRLLEQGVEQDQEGHKDYAHAIVHTQP